MASCSVVYTCEPFREGLKTKEGIFNRYALSLYYAVLKHSSCREIFGTLIFADILLYSFSGILIFCWLLTGHWLFLDGIFVFFLNS